jgi:tetratricopeptide (TPR) repeat protein
MSHKPLVRAAGFLLVVLLLARALPAAPPAASESANEMARDHFLRGVALYREGNFDAAAAEFSRAFELSSDYRLLYNLAQVHAERHDYVAAIRLFEEYLTLGGPGIEADRRRYVVREISTLTQRTAALWVSTNAIGADLWVNDTLIGPLPLSEPLLINPGVCRVRVEKQGYRTATHALVVAGRDTPRLELPLVEDQPIRVPSKSPPAPLEASFVDRTPFWISLAATAVSGGAAVGFAIMTRSADARVDEELDRFPLRQAPLDDARERLKTYAALADVMTIATAVGAAFSIYYLIAPPRGESERVISAADSIRLRVTPSASELSVSGSF